MKTPPLRIVAVGLVSVAIWSGIGTSSGRAQTDPELGSAIPEDYSCTVCHNKQGELWAEKTPVVEEKDLVGDIHWQRGFRCHDCHGGSPTISEFKNHRDDPDFRSVQSRAAVPALCGHCHSNLAYMRQFNPSARTDQEAEYWTSGHGRRLQASLEGNGEADPAIATCSDCHGHHDIRAVNDTNSPVYPTRVAETCSHCHSDATRMANRSYNGRPLRHDQYAQWRKSVHGIALLDKGDLGAPACNDCHGNHGAMPPGVDNVANACGTCHGKVAKLFAGTVMKHKFEQAQLPGCATCHGNHLTLQPSDEMLGNEGNAVCVKCHNPEHPEYGAAVAGATTARAMRHKLEELKREISAAETRISAADRLGMEVQGPRFDLRQAFDALTNARTLVHSFQLEPLDKALAEGLTVTTDVKESAEAALREHTRRRIWLATSLLPIIVVVLLLIRYIRTLPPASRFVS